MNITRNNYEIVFIDYLDGKLSSEEEARLHQFLNENPDLKEELDLIKEVQLEPDQKISYPAKEDLKHIEVIPVGRINESNYDEYFVAYLEGDLDYSQERNIRLFLEKNPALQKAFETYENTRLEPDYEIVYPDKRKLKKPVVVSIRKKLYWAASAAAAILLMLGFWFTYNPGYDTSTGAQQQIATAIEVPKDQPVKEVDPVKPQALRISPVEEKTYSIMESKAAQNDQSLSLGREEQEIGPVNSLSGSELVVNEQPELPGALTYRVEYLPMFRDMQLAWKMTDREERNKKDFHLVDHLLAAVKNIFTSKDVPVIDEPVRIDLWTLADVGVNGFSKMTNSDLRLETQKNEQGKVVSYRLMSDDLVIARSRKDKERED
ncbi:MAG: hypothetical protein K9I94_08110 [Bacteroidales bacterium]|nr:hypothetical protein [Bacteroidales bacterium]